MLLACLLQTFGG